MGVKWTDEQQKVIDLRNRNILVSAAAGSGKTAVLVERIITMLTSEKEHVDVDRLLIVTFTEAAAAEMKERIRNAIEKKLEENPEDEHLMNQSILIHNAQITTIHSFCMSVIRDHFHAIDIDPGFRVAEEGELKLLKQDVVAELLEERYAEGTESFKNLITAYGGKNDKKLTELILKIFEFSRAYPEADVWLDFCLASYSGDELENGIYMQMIKDTVTIILKEIIGMIDAALCICQEADGPYEYEKTLMKDRDCVYSLMKPETYEEMSVCFRSFSWPRLALNKDKTVAPEKVELVKAIREKYKKFVKDLITYYFFQTKEEMVNDLALCRPFMEEIVGLVKIFGVKFEEKKRVQNLIDFSDMEQYALRILTRKENGELVPSDIAKEYQEQFVEVMIDEYQDSNLIQETILTSVSGMSKGINNIFMVGDVKQSIYRFRLSRPELFMEKYNTYSTDDSKEQRIDLHKNFRSRREVLDSVNCIFRQIMIPELGKIRYDDNAALNVGASFEAAEDKETEILVINPEEFDGNKKELEAKAISARIRKLMKEHRIVDKSSGEMRPVRYSDIVILVRSISGFAEPFAEHLNKEGIPTHVGTREGYFSTQEVGVLLSYLQVLDNRRQDIPLAAVLASPFGNLNDQELAVIKSETKELPFYQAVLNYRECGENDTIRKKLECCLGQMDEFRKIIPYTPIQELLYKIMEQTGYADYMSAMPGGEQRKANLDMLAEKARAFESTSYKGLFHFVRYIEQLRKYDVDYGEANLEDEESENVRIMTIHKSKGLEFPIVFVAGMGKGFNLQDAKSAVTLHARLGVGLDAVNMKNRVRCPSIIKKIIQREEVLDTLGEELRILYVAFTRAKEKLIITGVSSKTEGKEEGLKAITYGRLSRASNYWDWILPAVENFAEDAPVRVKYLSLADIIDEDIEKEIYDKIHKKVLENWDIERIYNQEMKEHLEKQFSYEYLYKESQSTKLKVSVSELKKLAYEETVAEEGEVLFGDAELEPLVPKFIQGENVVKGALRGTAYHRFLELLDFTREHNYESLNKSMQEFCEKGMLEEELARSIYIKDILEFLQSPSGRRMHACAVKGKLKKEQPFVLGMDIQDEMVLIQGIIDVYFEEDDGIVILDYKTDRVKDAKELSDKYRAQLDYYEQAVERLTQKKVKGKIIYSFALKCEILL